MRKGVERTVDAALGWLIQVDAPEAAIAAHEHGVAESKQEARRWVRRILDGQRDGIWDNDLLTTARALLTLRELRDSASLKEQDPAIGRGLDWLRSRQGQPGAWTDGCAPVRHRQGLCHHFAAGFFSPAPRDRELGDVVLPSGAAVEGDGPVRFVASAVALRCTLLWRGVSTDAGLHLGVLRRLVVGWADSPPPRLNTTALLCALRALIASTDQRDHDVAAEGLRVVAGRQRGDGSWLDADPFHALAVFGEAVDAGVGGQRATDAVTYGARLLQASQREDGSWGPEHGARRALIGLRALRR